MLSQDNQAWQKQKEEAENRYLLVIMSNNTIPKDEVDDFIKRLRRMSARLAPREPRLTGE